MPTIAPQPLEDFATELLARWGASPEESRHVAHSLVESNLRGHDSHGVYRVLEYVRQMRCGELLADAPFRVLTETPSLLVADGSFGFGQIQCRRLVDQLVQKARLCGLACGTLQRCGHVGRLGEWVELATQSRVAALMSVNDNGVLMYVAPPGGIAPRISTNPLAIGVPTTTESLVLDMSTSVVARGKVRIAQLAGDEVPPGWVQDAQGNPTTDPWVLNQDPPGTLLPLGGALGFKGFGLGMLLDILTAGLSGGFCPPAPEAVEANNVLMVVWNPDMFAGLEHFVTEADKLSEWIRSAPLKPGGPEIWLPGEHSRSIREQRLRDGIPLPGDNWGKLLELAEESGVKPPAVCEL